jgi:hypothetical protein
MNGNVTSQEKVIKCFHCGNETLMHRKGESHWGSQDVKSDEYDDFSFNYQYDMYACPVCHKVTLVETYGDEGMRYPSRNGDLITEEVRTILYPINSIESKAIPPKIKNAFEGALKTKSIDINVCLMALRRTLELVLIEKGAKSWGLKEKIEEIAGKGILPDALKEASALTKILGDSAAHDKEIDIDQNDVNSMAEFVEYIIEYLYIVPDKISSYKEKLDQKIKIKREN